MLESAPKDQRGGATRWTTSRFRAREDYSLDPLFVGKVQKVSKGLADIEYCRILEREVPNTLRFLEAHGVKLLHYGPPVAMGVEHEVTPDGGGRAIVDALANSLEKSADAEILYKQRRFASALQRTAAFRAWWSAAKTGCCAPWARARWSWRAAASKATRRC